MALVSSPRIVVGEFTCPYATVRGAGPLKKRYSESTSTVFEIEAAIQATLDHVFRFGSLLPVALATRGSSDALGRHMRNRLKICAASVLVVVALGAGAYAGASLTSGSAAMRGASPAAAHPRTATPPTAPARTVPRPTVPTTSPTTTPSTVPLIPATPSTVAPTPDLPPQQPVTSGIPQGHGGDGDGDNSGAPSDGDGDV